jgi:hypothetical protein
MALEGFKQPGFKMHSVGIEPTPPKRLAPEASTLTTRSKVL